MADPLAAVESLVKAKANKVDLERFTEALLDELGGMDGLAAIVAGEIRKCKEGTTARARLIAMAGDMIAKSSRDEQFENNFSDEELAAAIRHVSQYTELSAEVDEGADPPAGAARGEAEHPAEGQGEISTS